MENEPMIQQDEQELQEEELVQEENETTAEEQQPAAEEQKKTNVKKEIISWILTLGAAVIAALLIRTFIFEPVRVDGESMCDTLQNGEIMFVTKPEYLVGDPEFGDVVICHYPGRKENFVKRVMGVPGDEIMVIANIVILNGEVLDEPYLTASRNDNGFTMAPFKLGEDEYFVMGDNRDNSHDSRNYYGWNQPSAITRDMIKGKVRWVVFPFGNIRGIE